MKIICSQHQKELVLAGDPMLFCGQSEWKCSVKGCPIKVGIIEDLNEIMNSVNPNRR